MVPVFGASRADAIQAKDAANVRSAYSEAVTTAMTTQSYDDEGNLEVTVDATRATLGIDTSTHVTEVVAGGVTTGIQIETDKANAEPEIIDVDENITLTLQADD